MSRLGLIFRAGIRRGRPAPKLLVAGLFLVLTAANATIFARGYSTYERGVSAKTETSFVKPAAKQAVPIKSAEATESLATGTAFRSGTYDFEVLTKSKTVAQNASQNGKLSVIQNEGSGAHFIVAQPAEDSADAIAFEPGWSMVKLSEDPFWEPGACASKPTIALGGDYIFVDDGKTDPSDEFVSFVLFDLQSGEFRYFGGKHFTEEQGKRERVMSSAYEDGKLVFYLDVPDTDGSFEHSAEKSAGYIIRRVIDASTLAYEDYKLKLELPRGLKGYSISWYETARLTNAPDAVGATLKAFTGKLSGSSVQFVQDVSSFAAFNQSSVAPPTDSEIELATKDALATAFPVQAAHKPYEGSIFKSAFQFIESGTYQTKIFGTVMNRYWPYDVSTPAVFDSATKQIDIATKSSALTPGGVVNIGVY